MNSIQKTMMTVILGAAFLATPALANETYTCVHDNQTRTITVVQKTEGMSVPCEVTYDKGMGAVSKWRAENKEGYCEEKAAAFVEKQRGWGWTCNKAM